MSDLRITEISLNAESTDSWINVFEIEDQPDRMAIIAEREMEDGSRERVIIDLEKTFELTFHIAVGLMECVKMTKIHRLKKGENRCELGAW